MYDTWDYEISRTESDSEPSVTSRIRTDFILHSFPKSDPMYNLRTATYGHPDKFHHNITNITHAF